MQYWHVLQHQRVSRVSVPNLQERLLSLWLKLMPFFSKQIILGMCTWEWACLDSCSKLWSSWGEEAPRKARIVLRNAGDVPSFVGKQDPTSSSALQPYFFPLISRLPGKTHLFQGHCKTGQNSSVSCDQMASQTLCTELSLGSRDLNSISQVSFIFFKHGNISEQQPSTFVPLFSSSLLCQLSQQVLELAFFGTCVFFDDTCTFFLCFIFAHKIGIGRTIWLLRVCLHLQGLFALC